MSVHDEVETRTSRPGGLARRSTWIGAVLFAMSELLGAAPDGAVPYPEGYREWVHVSSAFIGPQNAGFERQGGLHHIYANKQALEGYRTGRFPDGSVLVVDWFEPQEKDGVYTDGPRRRIDVMLKNGKGSAETGGWRFEQFKGDSRTDRLVTPETAARCFACHSQRKEQDFVFSTLRK
jgi:cytochrome P460